MADNKVTSQDLKQARMERRILEEKVRKRQLELLESTWSSGYEWGNMIDPRDRVFADFDRYIVSGYSSYTDRVRGHNWPIWRDENELNRLRQQSRALLATNAQAKGLLRNMVNYLVGPGFRYKAIHKAEKATGGKPDPATRQLVAQVQHVVDRFLKINKWGLRERETVRRVWRDGEAFLRQFQSQDDLLLRFVEPESITNPPGVTEMDGWTYGVQHQIKPVEDVETVIAYNIRYPDLNGGVEDEEVPAEEMTHIKAPETDAGIKRGMPEFSYDVLEGFTRASKLQKNLSIGSAIRAATAEIWQHEGLQRSEVQSFASGESYLDRTDAKTQKDQSLEHYYPGMIRRIPKGMEWVQPPSAAGVADNAAILQGDLRQALAAFNAPEYFSSDASNANYSSTKEAGTPFSNAALSLQEYFKLHFLPLVSKAVRLRIEAGDLPEDTFDRVEIQCEPPKVIARNEAEILQEDKDLLEMKVKAPQTIAEERNLDWEQQYALFAEFQKKQQELMPAMPGMPPGGGGPEGGPDGGQGAELPPHGPMPMPTMEGKEEPEEDPQARAEAIADFLIGMYGDKALEMFDAVQDEPEDVAESLLMEGWNAIDHPRGKGGRFIPKNSPEAVAAAHDEIAKALKGKPTPEGLKKVTEHLSILTTDQIHDLKKKYQLKGTAKNREELVAKIADRLNKGRREEEGEKDPTPPPAPRASDPDSEGKPTPAQPEPEAQDKALEPALQPASTPNPVRAMLDKVGQGLTSQEVDATLADLGKKPLPELAKLMADNGIHGKPKSKADALQKIRTVVMQQLEMDVKYGAQARDQYAGKEPVADQKPPEVSGKGGSEQQVSDGGKGKEPGEMLLRDYMASVMPEIEAKVNELKEKAKAISNKKNRDAYFQKELNNIRKHYYEIHSKSQYDIAQQAKSSTATHGNNPIIANNSVGGGTSKEPWEMSWDEYDGIDKAALEKWKSGGRKGYITGGNKLYTQDEIDNLAKIAGVPPGRVKYNEPYKVHQLHVAAALAQGKPVPPEVLADYPDLAAKYGKANP